MNSNQYERSLNNASGSALGSALASATSSATSAASASTGILSTITSLSWSTWLIVVLVLAFLGINVFSMLAKGTDTAAKGIGQITLLFKPILDVFAKIFKFLGFSTLETVKQTANIGATGVSTVAGKTAEGVTDVTDTIESEATGVTPIGATSSAKTGSGKSIQSQMQQGGSQIDYGSQKQQGQMTDVRNDTLQRALNDAESHMNEQNQQNGESGIEPVDAYGSSSTAGKAGYCFIGEEQGQRSCAPVGANDQCMSGDVFPTNDVCMNPNLRVG
jgi:hypothetical protein